jgi:integrase
MPRRLRPVGKISNRTDREKLARRRAPHGFTSIAPGLRLGYRRCKGAGTWVMRCANGAGGEWTKVVGTADDYEAADGVHVFDFWQAADEARKQARGTVSGAPATWSEALADYEADLKTRGGLVGNATHVRHHLNDVPSLLNKPVMSLSAIELKRWRNDLVANSGMKQASVVRLLRSAKASLNHAADHDERIQNRDAWRIGLGGLSEEHVAIDRVVPDGVVHQIMIEADRLDPAFGLFVAVAAETGARPSQIARLKICDLKADKLKLLMPSSRKGRKRAISRHPVPISHGLADRLKRASHQRAADSPLLVRVDGEPWSPENARHLIAPFRIVAERVGIKGTTMYALRHSAITRALLANVPAKLVASNADTSLAMLERTYASYISHHGEDISRRGLLSPAAPAENVVSLPGRRP